jgi:predicted nicotinamide N-methyase
MQRGYETKRQGIAVAGVADLQIRSLLDRNQFFDPSCQAEDMGISSALWPLFGLLWPSGEKLAARMASYAIQPGERVLEIGCGLALASMVAHRRGADVTASDCHPLTEGFLQQNLRINQLLPMKYLHGQWGESMPPPLMASVSAQYDLIIGSDVLYERDAQAGLAKFITLHAAPGAQVWIVDPDRGNRSAFSQQMAARGFTLTQERLDTAATDTALAYKGRMLSYTLPTY